jgi:sodium-dependent dicarboxylate transporter 2/3/5
MFPGSRKTFVSGAQPLSRVLGLVLACGVYVAGRFGLELDQAAAVTAATTVLCAVWWCTEAVPIPVTSLVPFVVFPLTGVLDHAQLAAAWGDKFILLFMGGFMISRAAEKSRAHLRVADLLIRLVGTRSDRRIVIGFLLTTAFCSMWISNTATALILLPVAMAVIQTKPNHPRFAVSLLLAIAYGASIGGIATLIGTPPNGVMASVYEQQARRTIDFLSWMQIGVPVSALMLMACGVLLTVRLDPGGGYRTTELGPWTPGQRRVLWVLATTAVLWVTRQLPFGWGGWSVWLSMPKAHDATVALLAVVALFLIPSGEVDDAGQPDKLLDWRTARDIPWGILLLFAGGLAIAAAFQSSGLATRVGEVLEVVTAGLPPVLVIGLICLTVTFTTEVTSNTATTTLLMPILAAAAVAAGVDAALFMVPAALSASCAFMLPVATPPNAIVFGGSDRITIATMVRYGLWLNVIGVLIITLVCYFVLDPEMGLKGVPASLPVPAAR